MGTATGNEVKCVELFAGAGGAALGLEAAGFEHLALVEWDADACATLRAAGLGSVVEGDVRDLGTLPVSACDLLWSSFPCQAWSTAGKRRGAEDERNGWPWTVAAIDHLSPRWFLGENVRGLTYHRGGCPHKGGQPVLLGATDPRLCPGCYLERVIVPELASRFTHAGYWVLDAADYGVPQHRRRVILWAGPTKLEAPTPTHGPGRPQPWAHPSWGSTPAPTVTQQEVKGTRASKASGYTFNGGPDRASDALFMATGRRRLTVSECATLQDFPPGHPFQGTKTSQYRQVGNAVPPTLAAVVARTIVLADPRLLADPSL